METDCEDILEKVKDFNQRVADCEHRVYEWIDRVHRL